MDFHEYWELIPNNEQYESIGQEIVKYKRNLYDSETNSRDLSEETIKFLQKHLIEFPYPTQLIIYQVIDLKNFEKNEILEKLVLNTIVSLIYMIIENPMQLDKKFKLLNLLSNVYVSDYSMQKVDKIIVPALYDLRERGLLDDVFYLALLSRSSLTFLNQYLDYEQSQLLESFSQKSLGLKCFSQRKHWMESIMHFDNDSVVRHTFHENLYTHIALLRLILKMDKSTFFENPQLINDLNGINSSLIENDILSLSVIELSRLKLITKFMQETHSKGALDVSKSYLMTQFNDSIFKMENYEDNFKLLNNNHKLNLMQRNNIQGNFSLNAKTEMQLFNEYMIVRMYLVNIFPTISGSVDGHLIRGLLKKINDGNVLFKLLQTVFKLIFLRFEHVRKTSKKKMAKKRDSEPLLFHNNSCSTEVSDNVFADYSQHNGFIVVGKENLEVILNSMRLFLMSLDITEAYKNSDVKLRGQFSTILKSVDNALWRLRLVNQLPSSGPKKNYSSYPWLEFHITVNQESAQKISSDEENNKPKRKVHRKKLKKRSSRVLTRSTDDNDESSGKNCYHITESFTENSETRIKAFEGQKKIDSIISKVLMKPESLVALNLVKKDFESVEKIIKNYHLENSNVANEVVFFQNYDNTLDDLGMVARKYESIYKSISSQSNEVDDIKIISEAGFEVAKLNDILDKYYEKNDLKHNETDGVLLERLLSQHLDLSIYQQEFLKISSLVDFIITLPSHFELNQNIFKFIGKKMEKRWNTEERNEFFMKFLKRIMDVQAFLESGDKRLTMCEILNQETFSFDPHKFMLEFKNRESLKFLMAINDETLNDEAVLQDFVEKMESFKSDVDYIKRVINYVRNIRLMTKFQTNDFFKVNGILCGLNVSSIIGKIVYVNQYNPEHLANLAFNSNINLFHSITIAGTGEILPQPLNIRKKENELLSLFYLGQIGTKSMSFEKEKKIETFSITSTDILYYIKKSSFLVAYLLKEIQNFDYKSLRYDDAMNFFLRLRKLDTVKELKNIFDNNLALATLNYDCIDLKMVFSKIEKLELREKLKMLACLTERRKYKTRFNELMDHYLEKLIEKEPKNVLKILNEIGSSKKFCELLLKNVENVKDDEELERLLGWCLSSDIKKELGDFQRNEIERWLQKLKIYQKILKIFRCDQADKNFDWIKIMNFADKNAVALANYLLTNSNLELCYEMLKIHSLHGRTNEINLMLMEALNKRALYPQQNLLMKIIHTLPTKDVIVFFDYSLSFINNLSSMRTILEYLSRGSPNPSINLQRRRQKFKISCKILENLDMEDRIWSLAPFPLILLEQLLMNSKVEVLWVILKELKVLLLNEPSCNECSHRSKNYEIGETIIYEYDSQHENKCISSDCIDFLLKIYAAKALDFQVIDFNSSLSEDSSHSCLKIFQMPREVPSKEKWVADDEAKACMCCKKSKFSLLNRRHHCRRCGRVVCTECSPHRVLLPEIYINLMVRCCEDCFQLLEEVKRKSESVSIEKSRTADSPLKWKLTGDLENDQIIRDEFNFEYSPNVNLCISIIRLHTINEELTKFLLFHCHRLELLLRPINGNINPEIDIVLVAKMLKNLATTAKLFGDMGESSDIIDQADMIVKIAENECYSFISRIPSNTMNVLETINELIKSENWKLALEISVKWDRYSTAGVFSAWAVCLIKGGQYRLAREKMALALQPVSGSSSKLNDELIEMFSGNGKLDPSKFNYKRPARSSPLLSEILEILECTAPKNCITETCMILSSTQMMVSLKKIVEGDYDGAYRKLPEKLELQQNEFVKSPYYEESIFFLIGYSSNIDIINFFVKNNLLKYALRYAIIQKVPYEVFTQLLFVPVTRSGSLGDFMELIRQIDASLWKNYIIAICKFLEKKKSIHVLYQIQLLTEDYIRASMTSIKFYLEGSGNYTELHIKARHLIDAKNHLQTELERVERKNMERVERGLTSDENGIQLKWNIKTINAQINLISLQIEVSKFLAMCESDGLPTLDLMPKVFLDKISLKTLLTNRPHEITQVAILLLICSSSISGAFGLVYRIIQACSLKPLKIYTTCTKYLARDLSRLMEVEKLINCIKTDSSSVDEETEKMCDELVALAVEIAYTQHQSHAKAQIDQLIKLINSKTMKIQCYINSNQLKTAFVNSVNNLDYIKRILKQAEITKQESVRRLCEKKLLKHQSSSTVSSTSDISNIN